MDEKTLKENYPGIELAYPIAVESYEVAVKRLDLMDGRLQTILMFAATLMVAVASVGTARKADFQSLWFYLGMAFFLGGAVYGSWA